MSNSIYKYYIYAYIRSKDSATAKAGTPYYIGKGTKRRAWSKHHLSSVPESRYIIILESNLSEVGAFALERRYIRWFGRKDLGTGILLNKTDGGEGATNANRKHSEETKRKMSKSAKGRQFSDETRDKIRNAVLNRSEETKKKQSEAQKGKKRKPLSEETKQKIRDALKGRKMTEEQIEKNRKAQLGKKHSEETKQKMSKSQKSRYNKNG